MVTTVKTRPNHYEVLGLTPDASSEQITQAFARELRSPRPFGSLAEVTVAFETLRDAAKRTAYDTSLAPKPEPAPEPEPLKFSPKAPAAWAPFVARPSVAELPPIPPPPASPPQKPHPLLERLDSAPPSVPRASMPEPLRPEPPKDEPTPRTEPPPQAQPTSQAASEVIDWPEVEALRALHFEEGRSNDSLIRAIKWNVPAFAVGCLLLSVLVGAWTGLSAGGDEQPDQPQRFARLKIASAEPRPQSAPELLTETPAELPLPQPAARTTSTLPRQRVASVQRRVEAAAVQEAELEANVAEVVAEPATAEATPAKLPLPNAVIARTIGRIGYPCGSVASAASLGGGSYKVTCTSGHSYRAAPVNGRYRFKQLG